MSRDPATPAPPPSTTPSATPGVTPAAGEAPILQHAYDGIQEFDNPLPGWWVAIFVLCAVHALGYFIWFHAGGSGKSETEQYALEWGAYSKMRQEIEAKERASVTEPFLAARMQDAEAMARGGELFAVNCVACHGPQGAGLVGPNLTDLAQIHGTGRVDLYQTVRDGVLDKGMVAWSTMLSHEQILDVTAYVAAMRGKNLPGKPAEGQAVTPF